jgi:O-antigen ligase
MDKIKYNDKKILYLLYAYSFFAGMGIEMPFIYLSGNFGIGEILFSTVIFIIFANDRSLKLHWIFVIPIIMGTISMISFFNAVLFDSIHINTFGYIFRFYFYSLMVVVYYTYTNTLKVMFNHMKFIIYGTCMFLLVSWITFFIEGGRYYGDIPTLAFLVDVNANTQAFYYSLASILTVTLLYYNAISVFRGSVLLVLLLGSDFLTLSKAGWVSIIIIVMVILLLLFKRKSKILVLSIISSCFLVIYFNLDIISRTISSRLSSSSVSNQDRLDLIMNGISIWSEFPIFGAGPKTFFYRLSEYGNDLYPATAHDAHNAFINILAEIGIIAFLLFLLLWGYSLLVSVNLYRYKYSLKGLNLLFFTTIVIILLWSNVTGLIYSDKIPWLLLAFLFSYKEMLRHGKIDNYYSKLK